MSDCDEKLKTQNRPVNVVFFGPSSAGTSNLGIIFISLASDCSVVDCLSRQNSDCKQQQQQPQQRVVTRGCYCCHEYHTRASAQYERMRIVTMHAHGTAVTNSSSSTHVCEHCLLDFEWWPVERSQEQPGC